MRNTIFLAAGALALVTAPLAAATPAAKPAAAPSATGKAAAAGQAPKMTAEQLANFQRGVKVLRLFTAAFNSDKVNNEVKGRLVACLYANNLAKISAATGQAIKAQGLDEKKPADVYRAAASVCGIVFKKVDATKPATGAKPSTTGR